MRKILVACVLAVGMVLFAVGCKKPESESSVEQPEEAAAALERVEETRTALEQAEKRAEEAAREAELEREEAAE